MIALHEILCAALFYSVFCRAVRMTTDTRWDVRLSLRVLGSVAAMGMAIPIHWATWRPDWFSLTLLFSITVVQLITAQHWIEGVPSAFQSAYRGVERRFHERRSAAHDAQ